MEKQSTLPGDDLTIMEYNNTKLLEDPRNEMCVFHGSFLIIQCTAFVLLSQKENEMKKRNIITPKHKFEKRERRGESREGQDVKKKNFKVRIKLNETCRRLSIAPSM